MISNLSDEFVLTYSKHLSKLTIYFNKITKDRSKENIFMAVSLALRLAAKISIKYGHEKSVFMNAASGNFDLEAEETQRKPATELN